MAYVIPKACTVSDQVESFKHFLECQRARQKPKKKSGKNTFTVSSLLPKLRTEILVFLGMRCPAFCIE